MTMTMGLNQSAAARELELHQLRVLLLINAVSDLPNSGRKLDGLTKLAKLDFIARYENVDPLVQAVLDGRAVESEIDETLRAELPMIRHKYGPWDDVYYAVLGALVGRGLVTFSRARNGGVGMSMTKSGRDLVSKVEASDAWSETAERYRDVADRFGRFTGNKLKEAIYDALPRALDVPHRSVLK